MADETGRTHRTMAANNDDSALTATPDEEYDPGSEYMSYRAEYLCVGPGNRGCPGNAVGGVFRVGREKVRLCLLCADEYSKPPNAETVETIVLTKNKVGAVVAKTTVVGGDPSFFAELQQRGLLCATRYEFSTTEFASEIKNLVKDRCFIKLSSATNRNARGSQHFSTSKAYSRTLGLLNKHCSWWPAFQAKVEGGMNLNNLWIVTYSKTNDEDEDVGGEEVDDSDEEDGVDEEDEEDSNGSGGVAAASKRIGKGLQAGKPGSFKWHHDKGFAGGSVVRTILTLGDSDEGKTMSVQDRRTGKWCRFNVPHGTLVTMSLIGSGVEGGRFIHRVDGGGGTYTIIMEGGPLKK